MNLIVVLVLCSLTVARAGWLEDMQSTGGLELVNGLNLHLIDSGNLNVDPLQRYSLRMDYSGLGLTIGKNERKDALQIGVHVKDQVEGRGKDKKMMEILIPALLGFKATTVGAVIFTGMSAFVLKAVGVAGLALILSLFLLVAKLFSHERVSYQPKHIEIEAHGSEHHPVFAEFPMQETGAYMAGDDGHYLAYANYSPSGHEATAESQPNYAVVQAPNNTVVAVPVAHATLAKRRDESRLKKDSPAILAVRKFTIRA